MAHAPGPWDLWGPSCGIWHVQGTCDEGDQIEVCNGISQAGDACLIAAAPDLLEACEAVDQLVATAYYKGNGAAVLKTVRAAIAKAKGEQPKH